MRKSAPLFCALLLSLSVRRAWIEISTVIVILRKRNVALRKESVDRNTSIDNITQGVFKSLSVRRAWIEIDIPANLDADHAQSLSVRRAWIEIAEDWLNAGSLSRVALRKESVDRNFDFSKIFKEVLTSLSVRRAWIEIMIQHEKKKSTRRRSP